MSKGQIEPIELPLKAGELLRQLEAMRAERPDDFETMPVFISMLEEGAIAGEAAQLAADPDGVFTSAVAAQGTAYRAQLHHAPSLDTWFVVIEGEDDDAFGDQANA